MNDIKYISHQKLLVSIMIFIFMTQTVKSFTLKEQNELKILNSMSKPPNYKPATWKVRENDGAYFPVTEATVTEDNIINYSGHRVAFSTSRPILPPSEGVYTYQKKIKKKVAVIKRLNKTKRKNRRNKKKKSSRLRKRKYRHGHKRRFRSRRSHRRHRIYSPHAIKSCTSLNAWTQINETYTMNDQRVTVLPYIEMNGVQHVQYIYQTMCADEDEPCIGVDNTMYKSECKTRTIFAFAFVKNEYGDQSWSQVQVKGSCDCALYPKIGRGSRRLSSYGRNVGVH